MADQLSYDYTFMMADVVGDKGATEAELKQLQPRLEEIHQDYLHLKDNDQLGFAKLPYASETILAVQSLATQYKRAFSTLVVLGIGGSDLGARAVHQALNHTFYNQLTNQPHRLYFAGANTDAKELADLIDILDFEQTAINVISKSGDTIETMSAFVVLRQKIIEAVGEEAAKQHIIVTTDAKGGSLRSMVQREGYRSLVVPADVGGRFSVLSSVGLFPLAYAGVDIETLLDGAAEFDQRISVGPLDQNPALLYAALQYLGDVTRGQRISVLMPYAEGLRGIAQWYRQLWAESLGKKQNLAGQTVNSGPTPIAAVGATDQHSQVQLYAEGPFDKLITFITTEESSRSLLLEAAGVSELSYLDGLELHDILLTEARSTAAALAHNGRPSGTILLPRIDEFYLGQLLYFFEVACMYAGSLYQINAYNQPGVELGKQLMYAQLGREGYADKAQEFQTLLHPTNRKIV